MKDLIAGIFAGFSQVIFGHPFDTVIILIQNKYNYRSLPLKDYYRGYRFPLVSASILNTMSFSMVARTYPYTRNYYLSGAISGFVISPIVFLFDIGKIKSQTKQKFNLNTFVNNKGIYLTYLRETTAMTFYFGSYYTLKESYNFHPLLAGGSAGLINWTLTYPIDVIRNRQISQNCSFIDAFNQKNFWKGFKFCAMRSIIVNAAVFSTYETVFKFLS